MYIKKNSRTLNLMITRELIQYTKDQLALGKTKGQIRQDILSTNAGWSSSDIDDAFRGGPSHFGRHFALFLFLAVLVFGMYAVINKEAVLALLWGEKSDTGFQNEPAEKKNLPRTWVRTNVPNQSPSQTSYEVVFDAPATAPTTPSNQSQTGGNVNVFTPSNEVEVPAVTNPTVVVPETPITPVTPVITVVDPTVVIENFETSSANDWKFYGGAEFPGASGNFSVVSGRNGKAGRLSFSMSGSAHYVLASKALSVSAKASTVSLWLKAPLGVNVFIKLVDSTGQNLQFMVPRTLEAFSSQPVWTYHTIKRDSPVSRWAGAADGVIHYPITSIEVGVEPSRFTVNGAPRHSVASGLIEFDDISFDAPDVAVDPNNSLVYPLSGSNLQQTFGFSIHASDFNDVAYDRLRQLGASLVRTDLAWSEVEKEQGVYDFSKYDELVSKLNGSGVRILFILDYGNSVYGLLGNTGPSTVDERTSFGNFAKEAALHYKNSNVIFEVWNEPNLDYFWAPSSNPAQYAELSKEVIQKIKEGNPSAQITTGGISGADIEWLSSMLASGGASGASAIGWHPYQSFAPEDVLYPLVRMKQIISSNIGANVPIWNTEWGYSSAWYGNGGGITGQRVQAKLAVRQIVTSFAAGFPFNTYYDLVDDSSDTSASEYNFGLYNRSGEEKLAGRAMRLLHEQTAGWRVSGFISTQWGIMHLLKLERGAEVKIIAWLERNPQSSNAPISIALPLNKRPSSVMNFLGAAMTYDTKGNLFSVNVTDEPLYIEF